MPSFEYHKPVVVATPDLLNQEQECDNLYVKELPAGMTDHQVREIFSAYGGVKQVKVLNSAGITKDGRGMSVALVRMGDQHEATWLVEHLDGNIPQGLSQPINVKFATSGPKQPVSVSPGPIRAPVAPSQRFDPFGGGGVNGHHAQIALPEQPQPIQPIQPIVPVTSGAFGASGRIGGHLIPGLNLKFATGGDSSNLYIKNLPKEADDLYLYQVFSPFGCVLSVKAKQYDWGAIGFVKYATDAEAQNAIENVSGLLLTDGNILHVSVKAVKGGDTQFMP